MNLILTVLLSLLAIGSVNNLSASATSPRRCATGRLSKCKECEQVARPCGPCVPVDNGTRCGINGKCKKGVCEERDRCKNKTCKECRTCEKGKCKPVKDDTPCKDGKCSNGRCKKNKCLTKKCSQCKICDPKYESCKPKADGTPCNDGKWYTYNDKCIKGKCKGKKKVPDPPCACAPDVKNCLCNKK